VGRIYADPAAAYKDLAGSKACVGVSFCRGMVKRGQDKFNIKDRCLKNLVAILTSGGFICARVSQNVQKEAWEW
jgi:hypothetical protein